MARTILTSIEPTCDTGACDLKARPAGRDGTYRDTEVPLGPQDTPSRSDITLKWNGKAYIAAYKERDLNCTPATGTVIPKGYQATTTWTLTFVAPSGETPARAHGTIVQRVTGSQASKAKGCTDFTTTEALGGVPTGSLDRQTAPDGQYDASSTTTSSTPKSLSPVGQVLWLGPVTVSSKAGQRSLTAIEKTSGVLTLEDDGWAATTPTAALGCRNVDGSETKKGADQSETFRGLHPVALTKEGQPIFTGSWRLRSNPNAAGLAATCGLAVYEGRLLLVPHGAGA